MSRYVVSAMLLIVAVIHLIPLTGILGAERLQALYGIRIDSNEMEILMRHRAVLFGILGFFFAYAAFRPELQLIAFLVAFASIIPFFYLALSVGGYNEFIQRIVVGDVVASGALLIAVIAYFWPALLR